MLLETNQVFKIDNLIDAEVGVSWNSLMASGTSVPPEHLGRLEQLWQDHLDKSGRGKNAEGDGSPVFPEEVEPTMTFPEGAVPTGVASAPLGLDDHPPRRKPLPPTARI